MVVYCLFDVVYSTPFQRVNFGGPAQPQVHGAMTPPHLPTVPDSGSHVPIFFPSIPTLPPSVTRGPRFFDPRVDPNPLNSITVSPLASSESSEELGGATSESDSSEELVGTVVRPPFNFRYSLPQHRRRRRQALGTPKPPHTPVFLSVFPSSPSPFRSCPGPSRYTTV